MRILIELFLTILFFTIVLKFGWPWTVVFVLVYILAFDFKLPYLAKRIRLSTRFLVFLTITLPIWLTSSWIIGRILFSPQTQAWIASSRFWTFVLTPDVLKMFWAAAGGFVVTALLALLVLAPYGLVAGPNMYSQYEQYKGHELDAARSAIGALLGLSRGTWVVSDGKSEVRADPSGSLARFGGPGILIVQEGHAVILEVSGKVSRVVGRGITWLKPFERISMVVPLSGRAEKMTVEQVATKDKVLIEEFDLLVFHKVDPGPEEERVTDGLFSYNEQKLLKVVWSPGGSDWAGAVRSISENALRDVVGRYDLEEMLPMSDKFREDFKRTLTQAINRTAQPALAVQITGVDIGKIRVPEEAQRRLLDKWLADWGIRVAHSEREAMIRKGEAEAVILKVKEVAWAQAQKQIIEEITAGFRSVGVTDGIQVPYVIALRSLETLEKMAADPATKILLPTDMMNQLQGLRQIVQESTALMLTR